MLFVVVIWIVLAACIGAVGGNKGRSGFAWFLLALVISPLLALFFVMAAADRRPASAQQPVITQPALSNRLALLRGDGQFRFPIVGESHYQQAISDVAGGYDKTGKRRVLVTAYLVPEPTNPYDPNAVAVEVRGSTVGYLARDVAPVFKAALARAGFGRATCDAVITGGWDRGDGDRGDFGVQLDTRMPFVFEAAPQRAPAPTSTGTSIGEYIRRGVIIVAVAAGAVGLGYFQWQARHQAEADAAATVTNSTVLTKETPPPPPVAPPAPKPKAATQKAKPKLDLNAPMNLVPVE